MVQSYGSYRIAEPPRLKMNSVSDLGVCGYCVLLIRPWSDRGRLSLMEGEGSVDGRYGKASKQHKITLHDSDS